MSEREITIRLKVLRRISAWGAAALLMCCAVNELLAESMTMTTYYPSPSGVYKRLTATDRAAIGGGAYTTSAAPSGGLIVSGNVGIGTITPAATLDVGGTGAIKFPVGDSTNRPASLVAGIIRYNTTLGKIEFYDGTSWKTVGFIVNSDFSCSGGNTVADRGGYRIHTFTTSGQFTVRGSGDVDVLLVGGGGGGGGKFAGGGGGVDGYGSAVAGGQGGSGIVIIRYPN